MASLQQLEEKLTNLQSSNVQDLQKDILEFLYEFRENFYSEVSQVQQNGSSAPSQQDQEQLEKLKKENEKLKYRVNHLTRNFEDGLTKVEAKQQQEKIEQLEKENTKLKYRVNHLVKNLEAATQDNN